MKCAQFQIKSRRSNSRWQNFGFRGKMILAFISIALIPLTAGGLFIYTMGFQMQLNMTQVNMLESVIRTNQLMDVRLRRIYYSAISLALNNDFSQLLLMDQQLTLDAYEHYQLQRRIAQQMRTMLWADVNDSVYSAYILTQGHSYDDGGGRMFIPVDGYLRSDIRRKVLEGRGRPIWIPTYSFASMFHQPELNHAVYDYDKLFTFAHAFELRSGFLSNSLSIDKERDIATFPFILVQFSPDFYRVHIQGEWTGDGAVFYVHDDIGHIISSGDRALWGSLIPEAWLTLTIRTDNGSGRVTLDGQQYLLCFARSSVTGWTTSVLFPYEKMAQRITPTIGRFVLMMVGIMLLLTAMIIPGLLRMMIMPIKRLQTAILSIERGNYTYRLEETDRDEFGELAHRFNQMGSKLNTLVHENYEVRLREREMEILALQRQINPHFLYNTLNILHFKAMASQQYEIDRYLIALSKMLEYTADIKRNLVFLSEDIEWLEYYLLIMSSRFEGRFNYSINIPPELLNTLVPKLFLQPLVENAIIHGLATVLTGGTLTLRGYVLGKMRVFEVEDNGVGIPAARLDTILRNDDGRIGILSTNMRIHLLYGELYGVEIVSRDGEGTLVTVRLPLGSV